MRLLDILPSPSPTKRYMATFELDNGKLKRVKFGDPNMESYIIHGDKDRRKRYRQRHLWDLRTNDPTKPGYLSFFILWGNSKSMNKNIATYKRIFHL